MKTKIFFSLIVLLIAFSVTGFAQKMPQDNWYFDRAWGSSGTGQGQFSNPRGIAVGADGNVYVTDSGSSNGVQVFQPNGQFVRRWAVSNALSIAIGPDANV